MGHLKDSMGHSEASAQLKTKTLGILTDLATGRYWNDVNRPNPVGGKPAAGAEGTEHPIGGGKELLNSLDRLKKLFPSVSAK
jgi:hypothetical protein